MVINLEDVTSYTIQYQEAFQKYAENEYGAKHRHEPVNNPRSRSISNPVLIALASGSGYSSFDRYHLSSNDEEYLMPNNVAETTLGWTNHAVRLLTTARLYLNSLHQAPKNWGQIDPNLNNYHSNPLESSSAFRILDLTDWWRQQEETHSKYADISNVADNICSIIPDGIGVEARFSFRQDAIRWR